jgi:hypothetical protein
VDLSLSNSSLDSLGAVQFNNLDETDVAGSSIVEFPTLADIPILITVSATLYVLVWNATSELDFESDDYRLNVPFVFLDLH